MIGLPIWLHDALLGGVVASIFAVFFNAPRNTLVGCGISGFIAILIRNIFMQQGLNVELATLIAAGTIGFLGIYFSYRWDTPTAVFTISGSIPMAPGIFAYQAMIGAMTFISAGGVDVQMAITTWRDFMQTCFILAAIATGITIPTLLFKRFKIYF